MGIHIKEDNVVVNVDSRVITRLGKGYDNKRNVVVTLVEVGEDDMEILSSTPVSLVFESDSDFRILIESLEYARAKFNENYTKPEETKVIHVDNENKFAYFFSDVTTSKMKELMDLFYHGKRTLGDILTNDFYYSASQANSIINGLIRIANRKDIVKEDIISEFIRTYVIMRNPGLISNLPAGEAKLHELVIIKDAFDEGWQAIYDKDLLWDGLIRRTFTRVEELLENNKIDNFSNIIIQRLTSPHLEIDIEPDIVGEKKIKGI